jgi:hypothetical protein
MGVMANSKPPDNNLTAMTARQLGLLPTLGMLVVTLIAIIQMNHLAQYLYITKTYGQAAWDSGFRVIDKQGHLSNGRSLTGWGNFFVFFGGYLMSVPFFLGSGLGLCYINMKLRGEKLREQLSRWRSEHPMQK